MTRYMLDTNIVSHLLRNHPAASARLVKLPITAVCISVITQAELLFGLARRPEAKALHKVVGEFLRRVDVLPWDSTVAPAYANARATLERGGHVIAPMDLLIGSHALAVGAVLVTSDRAFAQLTELTIEDWSTTGP